MNLIFINKYKSVVTLTYNLINIIGIIVLLSTACITQNVHDKSLVKSVTKNEIHFAVRINLKFPNDNSYELKATDNDRIYYDQAVLKLPKNYSGEGTPVRLVYLAHGAGGGVADSSWAWSRFSVLDSLAENGYACFDVNGGPNFENMGGTRVVQSAFKAYEYIKEHYNVFDKMFVIGGLMGGLSSVNFVYTHSNIVLANAIYSPVLDLYGQTWMNPWYPTTRKAIATAYNFIDASGKTWEPEKIIGWDPLYINTINNGKNTFKIYPVPVKIWRGINDRVVRAEASRKFQRYIQNIGGIVNNGNMTATITAEWW